MNFMLKDKRGVELATNTIIILIILIIALVIIVLIFTGALGNISKEIMAKIKWAFGLWPK
jgi:hypothetical protein